MSTNKIRISEKEEGLVESILNGVEPMPAYRRYWVNNYSDAKARHAVKVVLAKKHVQEYMQAMVLERQGDMMVDESFVISNLKKIILDKPGSSQAVKALELLGKYQSMWIDKQVVEDNSSQRDIADMVFDRRMKMDRGEAVGPIEHVEEEIAQVMEFELYTGTNG